MTETKTRVLVAEDSATQAQELEFILESENFAVELAGDGNAALMRFKRSDFDLVLTDIIMPEMDGYELCRRIKSLKKDIPVILLTSLSEAKDIMEGLACGADNFISKPFDPDYLIDRIKYVRSNKHLRSKHNAEDGVEIQFGGEKYRISLENEQVLDFLVSTFGDSRAKRIEQEVKISGLQESEAKFRAVVEAAPNGMLMINSDSLITLVNSRLEQLFGYPRYELNGRTADILIPPKFKPDFITMRKDAFLNSVEAKHFGSDQEFCGLRKDGSEFPIEIGLYPITSEVGIFVLVSIVDITARKEAQKRMDNFYAMITHEMRTPLTSIHGMLRLMENGRAGDLPAKAARLVGLAVPQSEQLIRLINDILDVKKLEAGKLELHVEAVEPVEIIDATLNGMRSIADQFGVKLIAKTNGSSKVLCDRGRIVQVLTNLVSNAIKFSPRHGNVIVSADMSGDPEFVRFSVVDNGPGIPEDQIHKLFGLFQQLNTVETNSRVGTGLGLAMSKAIVEQHNGKIGVRSVVGQGSEFWFDLPYLNSEIPQMQQKRSAETAM